MEKQKTLDIEKRRGNHLQRKRVEYQKFLRTKLEQSRYRALFGLSDNIELEAEEDFVLQREFRIDFVFQKIEPPILLAGLFSYFRTYNLFEFKSVNDAFGPVELRKYLGELFWWLYTKEGGELEDNEVTMTIMTVRRPSNVLKYLERLRLQVGLINESPGHYHWLVMGIPVHLLVINELDIRPEHYAWLSLAEGKRYEAYREQLSEDISQDETSQIYIDIISELEKEGKERMAYEVISRILSEMPPERAERILLNLPVETLFRTLSRLPAEQLQPETLFNTLSRLPAEQLQEMLSRLPAEQLQKALRVASGRRTSTDKRETESN